MTKTLDQYSPEERAECVGMWVDTPWGLGVLLEIYDDWGREGPVVWCYERSQISSGRWLLNQVTLRPDLPRAWNPDGTPIKGHWDYGEHLGYTVAKAENAETADLRCFVGEWEPA